MSELSNNLNRTIVILWNYINFFPAILLIFTIFCNLIKEPLLEKYIPPLILSLRPNVNKTLQTQQGNKMCILKVEHAWVCRILSTEVVNQHELCWTQSDIEFFS